MPSIITEQQQHIDSSGQPIVNGYIHIGARNTDPKLIGNKITIYSDSDLGTPLANPQRTDAYGRSENKIYVPGKYSIAVTDEDTTQKFIDLDAGELPSTGITQLTNIQGTNTIIADGAPAIDALVDKQAYIFQAVGGNTGPVTLQIDLTAQKAVKKQHDQALVSGDIETNQIMYVVYNELDDWFEMVTPPLVLSATDFNVSNNLTVGGDVDALTGSIGTLDTSIAATTSDPSHIWVQDGGDSIFRPQTKSDFLVNIGLTKNWLVPFAIGTTTSLTIYSGTPNLSSMTDTDVAFFDTTNDLLITYRFGGSTFSTVGSSLSITPTSSNQSGMAKLNSTDQAIVRTDGSNAVLGLYRWNGSTWALQGSELTVVTGVGSSTTITALDSTTVVIWDNGSSDLTTYSWSGSAWASVGSSLVITSGGVGALTTLDSTTIAFWDSVNQLLETYSWSGSAWSLVGTGLSVTATTATASMEKIDTNVIAFIDSFNKEFRLYEWSGSVWAATGIPYIFATLGVPAICLLNNTDLVITDSTNDTLSVYRHGIHYT